MRPDRRRALSEQGRGLFRASLSGAEALQLPNPHTHRLRRTAAAFMAEIASTAPGWSVVSSKGSLEATPGGTGAGAIWSFSKVLPPNQVVAMKAIATIGGVELEDVRAALVSPTHTADFMQMGPRVPGIMCCRHPICETHDATWAQYGPRDTALDTDPSNARGALRWQA